MTPSLSLSDVLAEQEVTIIITLAADKLQRDERSAMISVGFSGKLPVIKTGAFSDVPALIHEAWMAFNVKAQVEESSSDVETITEEEVLAVASTDGNELTPTPPSRLSTPKPQAKNLSLF